MAKVHGSFVGTYTIDAVFPIVVIGTEVLHAVKSLRKIHCYFGSVRIFFVVPAEMNDKERRQTENFRFLKASVVRPAQVAVPVYVLSFVVIRQECLQVDALAGAHSESEVGVGHGLHGDRPPVPLAADDVEVLDVEVVRDDGVV